jgi:hypothetical protein
MSNCYVYKITVRGNEDLLEEFIIELRNNEELIRNYNAGWLSEWESSIKFVSEVKMEITFLIQSYIIIDLMELMSEEFLDLFFDVEEFYSNGRNNPSYNYHFFGGRGYRN